MREKRLIALFAVSVLLIISLSLVSAGFFDIFKKMTGQATKGDLEAFGQLSAADAAVSGTTSNATCQNASDCPPQGGRYCNDSFSSITYSIFFDCINGECVQVGGSAGYQYCPYGCLDGDCLPSPTANCTDHDGDGYGSNFSTNITSCPNSGVDCNDYNSNIHPFATELCDSVDNDCDSVIDEGCGNVTNYFDLALNPLIFSDDTPLAGQQINITKNVKNIGNINGYITGGSSSTNLLRSGQGGGMGSWGGSGVYISAGETKTYSEPIIFSEGGWWEIYRAYFGRGVNNETDINLANNNKTILIHVDPILCEETELDTPSSHIYVGDQINTVKSVLTETDLPSLLRDGTFTGSSVAEYEQDLFIGNGTIENSSDGIFISVTTNPSKTFYRYSLTFDQAIDFTNPSSIGENLDIFGYSFKVMPGTTSTNLYLLRSPQSTVLSIGGNSPSARILNVENIFYTVELVSATDTSATIKVTDSEGFSDSRQIAEGTSRELVDLQVFVESADETGNLSTASLIIGAEIFRLTPDMEIMKGNLIVYGNKVILTGESWNSVTSFSILFYSQLPIYQEIFVGDVNVNPVFKNLKLFFESYTSVNGAKIKIGGCPGAGPSSPTCGDTNGDGNVNILDIVRIINYIYKNGTAPVSMWAANVNGINGVNILDITYLTAYLYKNGPALKCADVVAGAQGTEDPTMGTSYTKVIGDFTKTTKPKTCSFVTKLFGCKETVVSNAK